MPHVLRLWPRLSTCTPDDQKRLMPAPDNLTWPACPSQPCKQNDRRTSAIADKIRCRCHVSDMILLICIRQRRSTTSLDIDQLIVLYFHGSSMAFPYGELVGVEMPSARELPPLPTMYPATQRGVVTSTSRLGGICNLPIVDNRELVLRGIADTSEYQSGQWEGHEFGSP